MYRQERAINRARTRFRGGPEKDKINPIWDSSRMWQSSRRGNSELGLAEYAEVLNGGPTGWTQ